MKINLITDAVVFQCVQHVEQSKPKCPRLQSFKVNPEFLEKPVILFFIKKYC